MKANRNRIATAVVATLLAVLFTTCESGMLEEIREVSQAAQAAGQTRYYTVTYNANGADTGDVPVDSAEYEQGQTVTVLGNVGGLARDGFNFAGWNTAADGHGTSYGAGAGFQMGTANVTLYARWTELAVYEVSFNSQGGSGVPMQEVVHGGLVNEPVAPTREGYTFGGWFKEPGCVNEWDFSTDTVTAERELFAKWTANTYAIVFHANGGTGSMQNQSVNYDQTVSLTSNGFTRTGYTFDGWATSGGGAVVYGNGASYTHTVAGNRNLYARWTLNSYSIIFQANGGTGSMANQPVNYDQTVTLTNNGFTRTGYAFAGWATTAGGSVVYANGASYTHTITSNRNLYARWTANSYSIIFHANGGSGTMQNQAVNFDQTVTLSSNTFTRPGYRFDGWAINSTGPVVYENGASYTHTVTSNRTLHAKWTEWAVGMVGPAGGVVFYDKEDYTNGWRYMEVWTTDEAGVLYHWKTSSTLTDGTWPFIGWGWANTYFAMTGTEHPAAAVARNATHGGYGDWFLPSKDELNQMYAQRDVIGGLASSHYWSSSESSVTEAWIQNFATGEMIEYPKDYFSRVRAVRWF